MFRSKTLFVLGAGSSHEVGLPIGDGLKKIIADKIDIKFPDGIRQSSGDLRITQAIREHAKSRDYGYGDINPYLGKAWQLRDALPQAISIDNLLDAHQDDQITELCGKLGIVRSILEAEQNSRIYKTREVDKIDFSKVSDTWFSGFIKILTENVAKKNIGEIFENVSFVNFNYDRCIQHYVYDALQIYYGIDSAQMSELMKNFKIIHPYGSVGKLPWQTSNSFQAVPYGAENGNILEISKLIKTFNEQVEEGDDLKDIRTAFQEAEIIVFLGFAFHKQNLELLNPSLQCKAKRIYATAYKISSSDCKIIKQDIEKLLAQEEDRAIIEINNQLQCSGLFKEYWRGLTSEL